MSSYWAGYAGQGLCLTDGEFREFLDNYKAMSTNKKSLKQVEEYEDSCGNVSEITFRNGKNEKFSFFMADDGCCEGFRLIPYRIGGKPNTGYRPNLDMPDANIFILNADHQLDGMKAFNPKKVYPSYKAFRTEFERKLGEYMPDDFDWDAHIGIYSYACYA